MGSLGTAACSSEWDKEKFNALLREKFFLIYFTFLLSSALPLHQLQLSL